MSKVYHTVVYCIDKDSYDGLLYVLDIHFVMVHSGIVCNEEGRVFGICHSFIDSLDEKPFYMVISF